MGSWAGQLGWATGLGSWAGQLGGEAREALWRRLFAHVLGNIDMLVLGSVRGRRLFAHVLGNIDMLVPREASQEVEFVPEPLFL